jgi:nucleoid-associated protein YgaU
MSNKSKVLVAVFIVAGIAGLIIFDLALSSSSSSSPAMAPHGSSNPRPIDVPPAGHREEVVVTGMDTPATDSLAALLLAARAQPPVAAAAAPASPPPSAATPPAPAEPRAVKNPPATAAAAGFPKTHKVASGDSWWTIAKQYYGEAQAHQYKRIQEANPDLKDKFLTVGREIVIPPPPDTVRKGIADPERTKDADVYTVQPGDTLEAISKKHYQSIRYAMEIFKFNQELIREPSLLRAGQQILIPKTPPSTAEVPNAPDAPDAPPVNGGRLHEVKTGDTLWDIARKYAPGQAYAMMDRIVKANPERLQSKTTPLRVGWTLKIPE